MTTWAFKKSPLRLSFPARELLSASLTRLFIKGWIHNGPTLQGRIEVKRTEMEQQLFVPCCLALVSALVTMQLPWSNYVAVMLFLLLPEDLGLKRCQHITQNIFFFKKKKSQTWFCSQIFRDHNLAAVNRCLHLHMSMWNCEMREECDTMLCCVGEKPDYTLIT